MNNLTPSVDKLHKRFVKSPINSLLISVSIISILFLVSCTNINTSDNAHPLCINAKNYNLWHWGMDDDGGDRLVRPVNFIQPNENDVLTRLNNKYPRLELKIERMVDNAITIDIANSDVYTEQMGTLGADVVQAEIVYNFTELESINSVYLSFKKGGSHGGQPGVTERDDIASYIQPLDCRNLQ